MASAYATKIAEGFSQKLLLEMYDRDLHSVITNSDYEDEINRVGSKLNILDFERISEKTYTAHTPLSADSIYENNAQLIIDQYKAFYFKLYTIDEWLSYIKNPKPTIVTQTANERLKNIDTYLFGLYGDVGAGNRVGTDYITGTVAIDVNGNVTGTNTTFTSAMVGRGFKATGHTAWYRVKTYTNGTTIAIEDDEDDVATHYSGGVINAGATYTIEAATVLTITTSNLLQYVSALKEKLDLAEKNSHSAVPDTDRWLLVPPEFETLLPRATNVAIQVPAVYEELVKRGFITELCGFKVFKTNRLTGNNTDGYRVLAGHPAWLTYAEKVLQVQMEEDITGDFGYAYKDLFVYGAKVPDKRRWFATEGFWKF